MILSVLLLVLMSISSAIFADGAVVASSSPIHFSSGEEWDMEHNVSFSQNLYLPGMEANSNGVYPVVLDIQVAPELLGVKEIEIEAFNDEGKTMVNAERVMSYDRRIILSPDLCPSEPGEIWFYRIRFVNHIGHVSKWSEFHKGYGAITGEAFIKHFEKYAMKPWEFIGTEKVGSDFRTKWEASEILEKVSAHSLKSLGDIVEHSKFHDGTVHYLSKASGFKGNIFFTYENFGELETIKSTGSFNMYGVGLSGNGKRCDGVIEVEGMYPATVDFSEIVIEEYNPTGNYILTQQGKGVERVPAVGNMTF